MFGTTKKFTVSLQQRGVGTFTIEVMAASATQAMRQAERLYDNSQAHWARWYDSSSYNYRTLFLSIDGIHHHKRITTTTELKLVTSKVSL